MRWYQFQLRKPKRWARRAQADGSALPKIKRVKASNFSSFQRVSNWVTPVVVGVFFFVGIGMSVYFEIAQHWISALFPPLFSVRAILFVLAIASVCILAFCVCSVVISSHLARLKRRLGQQAVRCRCHLCPRCGYSLQSRTDDAQPCPECGQRISRREAVRLWARFCR
ncbi:MAG: hypothetical protein WD114_03540 [Phycisphaerales bacterium]